MGSRGHYSGDERVASTPQTSRMRWHPLPPDRSRIKRGWWRRARIKVRIAAQWEARATE